MWLPVMVTMRLSDVSIDMCFECVFVCSALLVALFFGSRNALRLIAYIVHNWCDLEMQCIAYHLLYKW